MTLSITSQDGRAVAAISYSEHVDHEDDGRTRYHWSLTETDRGGVASGDDLRSGATGGNLVDGLRSLVGFLSAFEEARHYPDSENRALFPPEVWNVSGYAEEWALDLDDA